MALTLNPKLLKDISFYCQMNGFEIEKFINGLLHRSFMVEKYGNRPFSNNEGIKQKKTSYYKINFDVSDDNIVETVKKKRKLS